MAIAGAQALELAGALELRRSIYLGTALGWLGALAGGAAFGVGMTLAGGCGSRNLARLGAGNLKSLVVVLVLGLFALMTLRGLLASPRVALVDRASLDLGALGLGGGGLVDLAAALGLPRVPARIALALAGRRRAGVARAARSRLPRAAPPRRQRRRGRAADRRRLGGDRASSAATTSSRRRSPR